MAMTFRKWITCRCREDTPAGAVARAVGNDSHPRRVMNSRASWLAYLADVGASPEVVAAFKKAWAEYDRSRRVAG